MPVGFLKSFSCGTLVCLCSVAFQFQFIAFSVVVIDGHGPSNEMHLKLQPKKTKVILY